MLFEGFIHRIVLFEPVLLLEFVFPRDWTIRDWPRLSPIDRTTQRNTPSPLPQHDGSGWRVLFQRSSRRGRLVHRIPFLPHLILAKVRNGLHLVLR